MTEESILITGVNSGIGLEITKLLNKQSKNVIAGVRRIKTSSIFDNMDHVEPVLLDVTKNETINTTIDFIQDHGLEIKGLVNNVGITNSLSLMIYTTIEEMQKVFNVNLFGIHRISQACIPDLIKNKGRVVNISSISGIGTWYGSGTYSINSCNIII